MTLEYALIDLRCVREHELIQQALDDGREIVNEDEVTSFTWLTLDECDTAGALRDLSFTTVGWRLTRPVPQATPRPPRRETADDWLCSNCRRQVALKDRLCGECWLSAWKAAQ